MPTGMCFLHVAVKLLALGSRRQLCAEQPPNPPWFGGCHALSERVGRAARAWRHRVGMADPFDGILLGTQYTPRTAHGGTHPQHSVSHCPHRRSSLCRGPISCWCGAIERRLCGELEDQDDRLLLAASCLRPQSTLTGLSEFSIADVQRSGEGDAPRKPCAQRATPVTGSLRWRVRARIAVS